MKRLDRFLRLSAALTATLALAGATWAQCPNDDVFEDNDDCASATILPMGTTTGLVARGPVATGGQADDDYYLIQGVPAGHDLTVDVLFTHAPDGNINVVLYEDPFVCSFITSDSWTSDDNEQVVGTNLSGAPKDFTLRILTDDPNFNCNEYSVQVSTAPNPCLDPLLEDTYEPNWFCTNSPTLSIGNITGLFLAPNDGDSYIVTIPPGEELVVQATYDPTELALLGSVIQGPLCTAPLYSAPTIISSGPGTETLQMQATNDTGASLDVEIVFENAFSSCGNYDLVLTSGPAPCLAPGVDDSFEENDDCSTAAALPAGVHSGLYASQADWDYYSISVPAGERLDVTYLVSGLSGGQTPEVIMYDDSNCTNLLAFLDEGSPASYLNSSGATSDIYLAVSVPPFFPFYCVSYELNITMAPDPCLAPGQDDSFEDNEDCATASPLTLGTHTGLFVGEFDADHYKITVPAGNDLIVDQSLTSGVLCELRLWEDSLCSSPFGELSVSGFGPINQLTWSNTTGASAEVILQVSIPFPDFGFCTDYDLTASVAPNPCLASGLEDGFEPNQTCTTGTVLGAGTQSGLFVTSENEDWYSLDVQPGDLLTCIASFQHSSGDVDIRLYELGDCGNFFVSPIAASETTTDDELVQWVNTTGVVQTYHLRVLIVGSGSGLVESCNNYDLTIGVGSPVTSFCYGDGLTNVGNGATGCPCGNESPIGAAEGCANSLGYGAKLSTLGSASVTLDNLQITISQARAMQPALAIQGSSLISIPFKDGLLCMGNPTERLEVMFTDGSGSATTVESIAANGHVGGGDTRYYQVWYRDPGGISPCGSGSNFSHGLFINWQ